MAVHRMFFRQSVQYPFRTFSLNCSLSVKANNLKGKSKTAQDWLVRQLNDPYVKKARYDNYRARSAYKLLEIDEKFSFLCAGQTVIECGAAPGAWTQVVVEKINSVPSDLQRSQGRCIAVDLIPFAPVEGATCLSQCDIRHERTHQKIAALLENKASVDCVLSDMAPNASGVKELDHDVIMELAQQAWLLSQRHLSAGGAFLFKAWDGCQISSFVNELSGKFESVKRVKPPASRSNSSEVYVLARNFRR